MKKILFFLVIFLFMGRVWDPPLHIGDCFGRDDYSQRIVSLSPVITEELYSLGLEDQIVGVTTYCKAEDKEKVGSVTNANLEKIVVLRPDLVLAISLSKVRDIEKLKSLGIEVVTFPQVKSFDQLCEQFIALGRITGKEKEAEKIVNKAKTEVKAIKKQVEGLPKTKVFIQIGAEPLYAVGKDSFINDFIEFAGGENIAADSRAGIYSREKVIQQNPEVIIIVTMGIAGKKEAGTWEKFKTLSAVKNERIYTLDSYGICSPTPENFSLGLKKIALILHSQTDR